MTSSRPSAPRRRLLVPALGLALAATVALGVHAADNVSKVNGSVSVPAGQTMGTLSTVNGSISVAERATADTVDTVNGSISLGADARVSALESVNGAIRVAENASISGSIEAVNGAITLLSGVQVGGDVGNVNGTITLDGARVGGQLSSSTGSMLIGSGSVVEGGILMRKPKGRSSERQPPRIVIGPNAEVRGTLTFEREVQLYVHDSARIGSVNGATANRYSGSTAPGE